MFIENIQKIDHFCHRPQQRPILLPSFGRSADAGLTVVTQPIRWIKWTPRLVTTKSPNSLRPSAWWPVMDKAPWPEVENHDTSSGGEGLEYHYHFHLRVCRFYMSISWTWTIDKRLAIGYSFQRTHNFLHHPVNRMLQTCWKQTFTCHPQSQIRKHEKKSQKIIIQPHPMASSKSPNPIRSHQIPGAKAASSMAGSCSPLATHPMCPASVPGCSAEAQSLCSRQSFTKLFGSLEVQLLDGWPCWVTPPTRHIKGLFNH